MNFIEKDKNLIIPDSLTNLVDGTLFKTNNTCDSGIMLIHTLDIPCGGCVKALDNLSEYFVKLDKNHNIRTIIIASSSYMENEVEKYLFNYPYPILLDSSEIFKIRNKIIRDDILCSLHLRKGFRLRADSSWWNNRPVGIEKLSVTAGQCEFFSFLSLSFLLIFLFPEYK